jgi:hypothetical protein
VTNPTLALEELQVRLADGDPVVAGQFRSRLEPLVAALVRRTLRFPADDSPLQAEVRAEVRRLGLTARGELLAEDRPMVRLIAGRICNRLIDRFRWPSPRVSGRMPARETVSDLARLSCSI